MKYIIKKSMLAPMIAMLALMATPAMAYVTSGNPGNGGGGGGNPFAACDAAVMADITYIQNNPLPGGSGKGLVSAGDVSAVVYNSAAPAPLPPAEAYQALTQKLTAACVNQGYNYATNISLFSINPIPNFVNANITTIGVSACDEVSSTIMGEVSATGQCGL